MTKKVIILSSTPRHNGNSDLLCDQFAKGASDAGHSVEKIALRELKINYCTGRATCFTREKPCPQKDDMPQLLEKMIAADVLVLASPIYFYTMSGQLKTAIDRCCSRYTEMTNKDFYYRLTAADSTTDAMERAIEEFRGFLTCLSNPHEKGTIYGVGAWKAGEIKSQPAMQEAYEMGKKI